jgi:hypothetical protein
MLLALALLGGIIAAASSWIALSAHLGTTAVEPLRREAVVEAVLDLIHDDLAVGDFLPMGPAGERVKQPPPRVRVTSDQALEIDARAGGTSIYRFDRTRGRIERSQRTVGASPVRPRLLAQHIAEFRCSVNDKLQVLDLTLVVGLTDRTATVSETQQHQRTFTRRYQLP